jgi:hypothetical protein
MEGVPDVPPIWHQGVLNMARGVKINRQDAEKLLIELHGNVTAVARALGVSRYALHRLIKRYESLRRAREEGRAQIVGDAYDGLVKAVHEGKAWAILFVLKTLGKDEGFTERVEVVDGGHPQAYGDW